MNPSPITWTDYSGGPLNFVMRGKAPGDCETSPGCANCYARSILMRNPSAFAEHTTFSEAKLNRLRRLKLKPLKRTRPMAFAVDMGDLFHPRVPDGFIEEALSVLGGRPEVDWQILTKRAERLPRFNFPENVWPGVTVECEATLGRIEPLRRTNALVKFISAEPLLEPIEPDLAGIHWLIAGGESGPRRRPFKEEWALTLLDLCRDSGTAFFFKQGSGFHPGRNDTLDGREWKEWP